MRFLVSGNIKENKPLYYLIVLFLFFSLLYWFSSWFYFYSKYGFSFSSVFKYFFGDPSFPEKVSLSQVFQDIHIDLFMYSFFLLVAFSLFLLTSHSNTLKVSLVVLTFLSLLAFLTSDLAILFLAPWIIYLKLLSFFIFQTLVGIILLLTFLFFLSGGKEKGPGSSNIKLTLFMFSIFLLLFTFFNFFLFLSKIGFGLQELKDYYLGNPNLFTRPKTFEGLFKTFYPHIISMALLSLTAAHFLPKWRLAVGISLFLLSFFDNLLGFLIRFVSPNFAVFKLFSFLSLELFLLYICYVLLSSKKVPTF
ncbi:MAG: hypothetical protein ACK4SM_07170 [Aquificaceae bacterium]